MNGEMLWVSLSVSFLSDMKIKRIRKLPDGDKIIIVWIGIICLAAKTNDKGFVYLDRDTPYDEELLTAEFDVSIELLRLAMSVFKKYGMLSVENGGMIFVNNYLKYNEKADRLSVFREKSRLRVAAFRDRQKALVSKEGNSNSNSNNTGDLLHNVTVTLQNSKPMSEQSVSSQKRYRNEPCSMTGLPQRIENIIYQEGFQKETVSWLSEHFEEIKKMAMSPSFKSGNDITKVLVAFGGVKELGIDLDLPKIAKAIENWTVVAKNAPKDLQGSYNKLGLAGWIANRTWRNTVANRREETESEKMARVKSAANAF